jgi:hypothetical protein
MQIMISCVRRAEPWEVIGLSGVEDQEKRFAGAREVLGTLVNGFFFLRFFGVLAT